MEDQVPRPEFCPGAEAIEIRAGRGRGENRQRGQLPGATVEAETVDRVTA